MMRHIASAACGLWLCLGAATGAQAEMVADQGTVVELYTSQGCSSCPPADQSFADLADKPGVIALSLHVDYWDYIGWQDTFGQPGFTERQKSYARAEGSKMIYTPQMIVGGVARVEGNQPEQVTEAIRRQQASPSPVTLTLIRQGDQVLIKAVAAAPLPADTQVDLVRYTDKTTVQIERGENAGQSVAYHHVVTGWTRLADWRGAAPLELLAPAPGDAPIVVIIQSRGPGAILAAARLR